MGVPSAVSILVPGKAIIQKFGDCPESRPETCKNGVCLRTYPRRKSVSRVVCVRNLPLPRLVLGVVLVLAVYLGMLLYVMGQKTFYLDLLQKLRGSSPVEEKALALV